jgi:hypothetical protein
MTRAVNRFSYVLAKALKKDNVTIGLDALTTVPNFGGFNSQSLTPSKVPAYQGPTGIAYYDNILRPEYRKFEAWRKGRMEKILDMDSWLQVYFENYTLPKGGTRPWQK